MPYRVERVGPLLQGTKQVDNECEQEIGSKIRTARSTLSVIGVIVCVCRRGVTAFFIHQAPNRTHAKTAFTLNALKDAMAPGDA